MFISRLQFWRNNKPSIDYAYPDDTPECLKWKPSTKIAWAQWGSVAVTFVAIVIYVLLLQDDQDFLEKVLLLIIPITPAIFALGIFARREKPKPVSEEAKFARAVYHSWIMDYLITTLKYADPIDIGVGYKPEGFWSREGYDTKELPDVSSEIREIFRESDNQLFITGNPGGGKTILMLQLAKQLLHEYGDNESKDLSKKESLPIPVIFNLASWVQQKLDIERWVIEMLWIDYRIPEGKAKEWMAQNKLVYFFDGLNEISDLIVIKKVEARLETKSAENKATTESREAARTKINNIARNNCMTKLNTFAENHPSSGIVISSRSKEFIPLAGNVSEFGVIALKPIAPDVVDDYLMRPGYDTVQKLRETDETIQKFSQQPFLLHAILYAYHQIVWRGLTKLPQAETPDEQRRDHLLDTYVKKRLSEYQEAYNNKWKLQGRSYLNWLATTLEDTHKTIFYVEDIQPSLLQTRWQEILYVALVAELGGALGEPLGVALGVVLSVALDLVLVLVLGVALVGALGMALGVARVRIIFRERFRLVQHIRSRDLLFVAPSGVLFGVLFEELSLALVGALGAALSVALVLAIVRSAETDAYSGHRPRSGMIIDENRRFIAVIALFTLLIGLIVTYLSLRFLVDQTLLRLITSILFTVGFFTLLSAVAFFQHYALRMVLAWQMKTIPFRIIHFCEDMVTAGILRKVGSGFAFRHQYLREYLAGVESDYSQVELDDTPPQPKPEHD